MKPIIEQRDYEKSIYRSFGIFPFYLLLIAMIIAYAVGVGMAMQEGSGTSIMLDSETLATAFFRGTLGTVAIFYVARFSSIRSSQKSEGLKDMEEVGHYMTCMSHNSWNDLSFGNLIIERDRMYFQPDVQKSMELTVDIKSPVGYRFEMDEPLRSFGLFLVSGMRQMVALKNDRGEVVGRFVIAEPKENIQKLQALMK